MASTPMQQLVDTYQASRRRRKGTVAQTARNAETARAKAGPAVVKRKGAEDDAYVSYISGTTGQRRRAPLNRLTRGDTRQRRPNQPG